MSVRPDTIAATTDSTRLRAFWNHRYRHFTLSESGWAGAGEALNARIYAAKARALAKALDAAGLHAATPLTVLDAGCGQGYFARFYRWRYPASTYIGLDLSEHAIGHLRAGMSGVEFHAGDLCDWKDPAGRVFDVVQCIDVLHLNLDDDRFRRALGTLSSQLGERGSLVVTAARPTVTVQPSDYLRYRSRSFWDETLEGLGLRVVAERPMYYWLPAGGPGNRYARYALDRLPGVLDAIDRVALTLRLPQPASAALDSRMRLLTIQRTGS